MLSLWKLIHSLLVPVKQRRNLVNQIADRQHEPLIDWVNQQPMGTLNRDQLSGYVRAHAAVLAARQVDTSISRGEVHPRDRGALERAATDMLVSYTVWELAKPLGAGQRIAKAA